VADIPRWLEPLVEAAAGSVTAHGPEGRMGLRYREEAGRFDVLLYLMPVEMVGGAHDGGLAAPGFVLSLEPLRCAFSRVDAAGWDAHGTGEENADCGPCVRLEGEFAGRKVLLRVLAFPPDDVAPVAKVDATGRRAG
jgi:hypothetical protein